MGEKIKKFIDKYKQGIFTLFYIELDRVYWFSQPVELKTILEKISTVVYRPPIIASEKTFQTQSQLHAAARPRQILIIIIMFIAQTDC